MKITNQMFLAYRTYLVCKFIEESKSQPSAKKGITYMIRSASSSEVGTFTEFQQEKEKATTPSAKAALRSSAKKSLGTDGSLYKESEHTNNNLVPGESIVFAFGATTPQKIMASLLSISDVHQYAEKTSSRDDYTYETMIFAVPNSIARQHRYEGTYGKVWGDFQFTEYHLPAEEFEHIDFLKDFVVPDMSTWADNVYKTRNLDELIEMQSSQSYIDSQNPLSFQMFKDFIERNPDYGRFLAMAEDIYETYFADTISQGDDEGDAYDQDSFEGDDKEEDEFSDFSEWASDEAFNEQELKEIVSGVVYNRYYTPEQKRELLDAYADVFKAYDKVAELAQASGFDYKAPTPKKPEEQAAKPQATAEKPQGPEICQ